MDRVNVRNARYLDSILFVPLSLSLCLSLSLSVCLFYLLSPFFSLCYNFHFIPVLSRIYISILYRVCENRTNSFSSLIAVSYSRYHYTKARSRRLHGKRIIGCLAKNRVFLAAAAGVPTGVRISRNAVCIFSLVHPKLHALRLRYVK